MHSITTIYRNKIRNINPRRVSRSRMAGYSSPDNKHRGCTPFFSVLALLLPVMLLGACLGDAVGGINSNRNPTTVTNITITDITATSLTLNWVNPVDDTGFQGVLVSASPAAGTLATPQQQSIRATTATIAELSPITTYSFTLTSVYADSNKNSTSSAQPAMTATSADLPIDADADGFVDITSVERLHNIRYNLDLGAAADSTAGTLADDGRYKTSTDSAENSGMLCGTNQDRPCTGYELIISLDFANPNHYESGMVNADWRPQDSSGTAIAQADADSATNTGWQPIAYEEMVTSSGQIDNVNYTPFNTLFDGNHYTIRNLFVRRRGTVGLFGGTGSAATIRNSAVVAAALYGSDNHDAIGGLIGHNDGGTIIASYAESAITGATSTMTDHLGGLIGSNAGGTIIASYAGGMVNDAAGGAGNPLGGLVGSTGSIRTTTIIASYSSVAVTSGAGNDIVGGLAGSPISNTTIIASYASGAIMGDEDIDTIGGLVGENSNPITIAASYATGDINGGAGIDIIGGLAGTISDTGSQITASYAAGTIDGDGDADVAGRIAAFFPADPSTHVVATYGFGSVTAETVNDAGVPSMDTANGGATAADLTADTAGTQWNSADHLTLNAWNFGNSSQDPALQYADYDGAGNKYGCGDDSDATIVIPSVVPDGMGGTIRVICGTTLLPGQGR